MRTSTHNGRLQIKVSTALVDQAKLAASRKGMTLSELARHALRRELGEAA